LARTTYRAIVRHASAIDRDAALRAVLVAFPCSFYDRRQQQWTAVDVRQEWLASRRAVDDFVRELNGSSDWYLPHRTGEEGPMVAPAAEEGGGVGKAGKRAGIFPLSECICNSYTMKFESLSALLSSSNSRFSFYVSFPPLV